MKKGHRYSLKEDNFAKRVAREYKKRGYNKGQSLAIGYATLNKLKSEGKNI